MKVLILNGDSSRQSAILYHFSGMQGDITVIHGKDSLAVPKDPAKVDVIIGEGDCSPGSVLNTLMLGWRSHPHTYLIPCWFPVDIKQFGAACLWPRLAIDRFDPDFQEKSFSEWLLAVAEWQQNRMHFSDNGTFEDRSALELATSLCLRRASGILSIFDDEGGEGRLTLKDGTLTNAFLKHLRQTEAFYEFLCMSKGGYSWESDTSLPREGESHSLSRLISEGLKQIHDSNLLHHFIPDLDWSIEKTESESALDDAATASFPEQRKIYGLIEGDISASQVLEASPLSRPSTMVLLAKWFSLEDIAVFRKGPLKSECRVLIVDDSPLMCRALEGIFSEDPRLQVAGIAHDGFEALQLISEHKPDVITLDLQMPKMDGLTALKNISIRDPRPVVVLSAFTKETSRLTYESFKYGAVDVLTKPANGLSPTSHLQNRELCDRVVQASNIQMNAIQYIRRRPRTEGTDKLHQVLTANSSKHLLIVLCGAGGFPALLKLIFSIADPQHIPPTIIGMAMSGNVVEALVVNLKKDTSLAIEEISASGELNPGVCYFLGNDRHQKLLKEGDLIKIEANGAKSRNDFFDGLLTTAADSFEARATAILLSGTGEDGVEGMRRIKQAGGRTFALSPEACLRPDLPQKIISLGYAEEVKTIMDLAGLIDGATLFSDPEVNRPSEDDKSSLESL
jgi:two-component system, chemotaxis family, protein-glutamate methylesterase/glutaminase